MPRSPSAFRDMSMPHLECRMLNHTWRQQNAFVRSGGLAELTFSCARCRATRTDVYVRSTGELDSRAYHYPDTFLVRELKQHWGGRAIFNSNVRVELIGRYTAGKKVTKK